MNYSIQKIEDNIVCIENINDRSIKYINLCDINFEIKENDIITFDGQKYIKNVEEKNNRISALREKMNKLRG